MKETKTEIKKPSVKTQVTPKRTPITVDKTPQNAVASKTRDSDVTSEVKIKKVKKESPKPVKETEKSKLSYYEGIGRRKTAVARVRLYVGGEKGGITINDLPLNKHFSGKITEKIFLSPLEVTGNVGRFDIRIHVSGSGRTGQLGAIVHGLARALEKVDREKFRPLLKKQGFLTRDPRAKERRKVGKASNARKGKQSPKR